MLGPGQNCFGLAGHLGRRNLFAFVTTICARFDDLYQNHRVHQIGHSLRFGMA